MEADIREIYYSPEYEAFLSALPAKVQKKYDYVEAVIRTKKVVSTKFVKRLQGTIFFEARISVGTNEYRTVPFAIDAPNFMECSRVLFLNSFLKKDGKQYKKETDKALKILQRYELQGQD